MTNAGTPFRIAILGDFSGRASRGAAAPTAIGKRPFLAIDRDEIESAFIRLGVELTLAAGTAAETRVRFTGLDDFHPDRLFRDLEMFRELRELRAKLLDPTTFGEAAAALLGDRSPSPPPAPVRPEMDGDRLLAETLSATEGRDAVDRAGALVEAVVRDMVAPYLLPGRDPRQKELVSSVDAAIGHRMCLLLHDRSFQALESLWRSIELVARRIETSADLSVHLLDVTKEELALHFEETGDATSTDLYRRFVDETVGTPGAAPWSLIVVDALFTPGPRDIRLLGALASMGSGAGASVVAGAGASFLGLESLGVAADPAHWPGLSDREATTAWQELRRKPDAAYLGLIAPRFLVRLPYGARTRAAQTFDFEEAGPAFEHEQYLWGNGAFLAALGFAACFATAGWGSPSLPIEITDLPLHIHDREGETIAKPCAELLLTDRGAEKIAALGIMTLRSVQDADRVLFARLRSVHQSEELRGRWRTR